MSKLFKRLNPEISAYKDRRFEGDEADWERALKTSTTLYIGNLSFYTREEQIYEVFSKIGHVQRVIVGLDKFNKTPCGFCFVMYYLRRDSEACVKYLNGTMLDDRIIRVDHDWGFIDGRQWGRGRSGGQVRDEFRLEFDHGRGGYGKQKLAQQMEEGLDGDAGDSGANLLSPAIAQGDFKRRRVAADVREREEENPRFRAADNEEDA